MENTKKAEMVYLWGRKAEGEFIPKTELPEGAELEIFTDADGNEFDTDSHGTRNFHI